MAKVYPKDIVELLDGRVETVNSAHDFEMKGDYYMQMFSVCEPVPEGKAQPLYYANECRVIRRHIDT